MIRDLPAEVAQSLSETNDRTVNLFNDLMRREQGIPLLPPAEESTALSIICISDLAYNIQTVGQALDQAVKEWTLCKLNGLTADPKKLGGSIQGSRHYLDHAIVTLVAASNHLASGMWHFHENVPEPLGKAYLSAAQARQKWKNRTTATTTPPASLSILDALLDHPDWRTITTYRDEWTHRGLPVIQGELRMARRRIWQAPTDPAPAAYFMKITAPDGRVSYVTQADDTPYEFEPLLSSLVSASDQLEIASIAFVSLIDQRLAAHGISLHATGAQITYKVHKPIHGT